MLGSFGQAIILTCTIGALAITTPLFFLHASHLYVTTLTHSSGGVDQFRWPRETVFEWYGEGLIVLATFFTASAPALIPIATVLLSAPAEWGLAIWLVALGLIGPICICSMLTAPSPLLFIYPPLIGRLLWQGKGLVLVYLMTAPLPVAVLAGLWLILARQNPLGVCVVALALPPAILLHARAWGRLCWLAMNLDRAPKKRSVRPSEPDDEALDVALEAADDDPDAYGVDPARAPAADRLDTMTEHYAEQRAYERRLNSRSGHPNPDPLAAPKTPTYQTALGQRVISFVFDAENVGVGISLGCFALVEMLLVYLFATLAL